MRTKLAPGPETSGIMSASHTSTSASRASTTQLSMDQQSFKKRLSKKQHSRTSRHHLLYHVCLVVMALLNCMADLSRFDGGFDKFNGVDTEFAVMFSDK